MHYRNGKRVAFDATGNTAENALNALEAEIRRAALENETSNHDR